MSTIKISAYYAAPSLMSFWAKEKEDNKVIVVWEPIVPKGPVWEPLVEKEIGYHKLTVFPTELMEVFAPKANASCKFQRDWVDAICFTPALPDCQAPDTRHSIDLRYLVDRRGGWTYQYVIHTFIQGNRLLRYAYQVKYAAQFSDKAEGYLLDFVCR